jgi:hypothetical protein
MSGKKEKEKRKALSIVPELTGTERVEKAIKSLANVIKRLGGKIAISQKLGKIPGDYSLGFINGLIFVQHQLIGEKHASKFFDRVGSIGRLPVPVALRTQEEVTEELGSPEVKKMQEEIKFLENNIITQARGLVTTMEAMEKDDNPDTEKYRVQHEKLSRAFSLGLRSVKKAVKELEAQVTEKLEVYREEKKKMESPEELQQEAKAGESKVQCDQEAIDTGSNGIEENNNAASGTPGVSRFSGSQNASTEG